jgi:hypothetical protein
VHATFLITDANGVWWGQTRYEDFVTMVDRASQCGWDMSPWNSCTVDVPFPTGAYHQSGVGVAAVDAYGHESATPDMAIGYPGVLGSPCQNGSF